MSVSVTLPHDFSSGAGGQCLHAASVRRGRSPVAGTHRAPHVGYFCLDSPVWGTASLPMGRGLPAPPLASGVPCDFHSPASRVRGLSLGCEVASRSPVFSPGAAACSPCARLGCGTPQGPDAWLHTQGRVPKALGSPCLGMRLPFAQVAVRGKANLCGRSRECLSSHGRASSPSFN